MMNPKRQRVIKFGTNSPSGNVLYWMSRDQRASDNWALAHAYQFASEKGCMLYSAFAFQANYPSANARSFNFMLEGLKFTEIALTDLNIPFYLLKGNPPEIIRTFCIEKNITTVVTDFDPLKIKQKWKNELALSANIDIIEVDAHNIVPAFVVSQKVEFGAYTIRPKINKLLDEFLVEFPKLLPYQFNQGIEFAKNDYPYFVDSLPSVEFKSGEQTAVDKLKYFIDNQINDYSRKRNEPSLNYQSGLSPYIHFGQISAQRIALSVRSSISDSSEGRDAFLEELIVRRELSDNYCLYNDNYDKFEGFPAWAQETLNRHRSDKRDYLYSLETLEKASTHDNYWNAAQIEMYSTGKMFGYMRMYWCKKILEWTESPEIALEYSIYLNDKYSLDGRDPNGYAGIAWSIGGVHDRAWAERPIFGKIRYMNDKGLARKFDMERYVRKFIGNNSMFEK